MAEFVTYGLTLVEAPWTESRSLAPVHWLKTLLATSLKPKRTVFFKEAGLGRPLALPL